MSENKDEIVVPREPNDINREYSELCAVLGDRTVKLDSIEDEVSELFNQYCVRKEPLKKEVEEIKQKIKTLGDEMKKSLEYHNAPKAEEQK